MAPAAGERTAFVTGASRGIGASIARRLGASGYRVAVGYRTGSAEADDVVAAIAALGGSATSIGADVSDPEQVDAAFSRIEAELGPVDVLVNNAGVHRGGAIGGVSLDDWRAVIDGSLTSAFLCGRRAVPGMIERGGGRIIQLTSVVGLNGFPGDTAYAAAKAGLVGFTKALALEVARHGITVNAVAPGFIDTDMTRALSPRVRSRLEGSIPARRQGDPDEIAQAVEFLVAGPEYVTGSVLVADGGWTIA